MGHAAGAAEALSSLLGMCAAVRGGSLRQAHRLAGPLSPMPGETVAAGFAGLAARAAASRGSEAGASETSRERRRVDPLELEPAVLASIEAQALFEAADDMPEAAAAQMRAAAGAMVLGAGASGEPCAAAELRHLLSAAAGADADAGPGLTMAGDDPLDAATAAELMATAATAASRSASRSSVGGEGASPSGTGTSGGSGGAGTSASYSQLRLQFDLMQAEHREQLREMRRSLRKALRRIEGLKTARGGLLTGVPADEDPETVATTGWEPASHGGHGAEGGGDSGRPRAAAASAKPARRGSGGSRRGSGSVPPARRGSGGKRKAAGGARTQQSELAGDVADIKAEVARMRAAMTKAESEKQQLSRTLASTSRASAVREKRLTKALKAVAAQLPGGSKQFQSVLRSLSAPKT